MTGSIAPTAGEAAVDLDEERAIEPRPEAPPPPRPPIAGLTGHSIYFGLRAAMMLPQIAGPSRSLEFARGAGRSFAGMPFNRRRIDRAVDQLAFVLPDLDEPARRELALRSYEHLAMLAVEVAFLPRILTEDAWARHVTLGDMSRPLDALLGDRPIILITGHTGNWEVLGYVLALLGVQVHALYRPLDLKPLDEWVRRTRERKGLRLVDKFGAIKLLPSLLRDRRPVGFVADQNAGDRGLFVPFFGRLTSTYKSIGLLALRHRAIIATASGHRLGWDERPGEAGVGRRVGSDDFRFHIEVSDVFGPEEYESQPDPLFYLTARYRRAIERAVLRAPEQYLWMHRIWKSRPRHERLNKPFPASLRRKLAQLPWMDDGQVEAVVAQSERDRAFLAERGLDRLP